MATAALKFKPSSQIRHAKKAWLIAYAKCGKVLRSCAIVDVHRSTYQHWRHTDELFDKEAEAARNWYVEYLEDLADKLASKIKNPNVTALIFRLNAEAPEKYRQRQEVHMKITDSEVDTEIERELAMRSSNLLTNVPPHETNGHP